MNDWEAYCKADRLGVTSGTKVLLWSFLQILSKGETTMFSKLKLSLSRINYKLFFALLVLGLAPTVYTTVRVFVLGQLPGEYSFSIAGQLSWVNLLYEILNEAIILPLFCRQGKRR